MIMHQVRFLLVALFLLFFSYINASSVCEAFENCQQKGSFLYRANIPTTAMDQLKEHLILCEIDQKDDSFSFNREKNFFLLDEQQNLIGSWTETDLPSANQIICLFFKHCQLHRQLKTMTGCLDEKPLKAMYQTAADLQDEPAKNFILHQGLKTRERPFFLIEQYKICMQKEGVFSEKAKKQKEEIVKELKDEDHFYTIALLEFQELSKLESQSPETLVAPLKSFLSQFSHGTKDHHWRMQMMIAEVYVSFDQWNYANEYAKKAYENAPEYLLEEIGQSLLFIDQNQKKHIADSIKLHS